MERFPDQNKSLKDELLEVTSRIATLEASFPSGAREKREIEELKKRREGIKSRIGKK